MFKSQNFCHIASNNRNQVKVGVFVYRTTDDLATVLTSGYFNDRIIDINLHDLIIHEKVDSADATKVQRNLLCVTERSLENVGTTLIKSKWEGDIEQAIADLQTYVDTHFVKLDGTSVMTGPLLMRATQNFKCAIAPYWDGVGFFKLNDNNSVTLMASLEYEDGLTPATDNKYNLGTSTKRWKDARIARVITATLNNGYDIAVPVTNSADTLALKSEVDLAANSGRMITDQGVWYAKMYAATVAPSAENGTNYADFSQVDGQGNPIIVIYERQNGAWVQSETITPPAEYDGYVPITSKIWDIPEQAGQQGGRILWNHQSKDFTPYPQIISFENAALTGVSTAPTPTNDSPNNQIANKEYVDNKASQQGYHPDLFSWQWADHELNDVQWLKADTFSWQSGAVYEAAYQHLLHDMDTHTITGGGVTFTRDESKDGTGYYAWTNGITLYTASDEPVVGDTAYAYPNLTVPAMTIDSVSYNAISQTETVAGTTITYYLADDGHKICLADQESNVAAIYAATGVAWYYIIDTMNQRFKLPRTKYGATGLRDTVGKYVEPGLPQTSITLPTTGSGDNNNQWHRSALISANGSLARGGINGDDNWANQTVATDSSAIYGNSTTVQPPATQMYLYFYVGSFTQTAIENTAGLNAELFNDKADIDLSNAASNASASAKQTIISWAMPDYNSAVEKLLNTQYTADKNGFIFGKFSINSNTSYRSVLKINNFSFDGYISSTMGANCTFCFPVSIGDTYELDNGDKLYFAPCKGES